MPNITKPLAFILSMACLALWGWNLSPQRFKNMMGNVTNPNTFILRTTKYAASSLELIKRSPLFGYGLWSYRAEVFDAQARIQGKDPSFFEGYPDPKPESVHNEYLEVFNDGGIVAAAVMLWFLVGWFRRAIWEVRQGGESGVIATVCLCGVVGIMVNALFFFPFRINSTLFMTAVFMGMVYRGRRT